MLDNTYYRKILTINTSYQSFVKKETNFKFIRRVYLGQELKKKMVVEDHLMFMLRTVYYTVCFTLDPTAVVARAHCSWKKVRQSVHLTAHAIYTVTAIHMAIHTDLTVIIMKSPNN